MPSSCAQSIMQKNYIVGSEKLTSVEQVNIFITSISAQDASDIT